jgi:Putative prokaryotic signal transducing protein
MGVKGWAVVYKGQRIQAEIVAAMLSAEGLDVEVFGDNAYGVGIDLTDARLLVPDDQAERARRLIRAAEKKQV